MTSEEDQDKKSPDEEKEKDESVTETPSIQQAEDAKVNETADGDEKSIGEDKPVDVEDGKEHYEENKNNKQETEEEQEEEKEEKETGLLTITEWIHAVKTRQEKLAAAEERRQKEWNTQWTALQAYAQVYGEITNSSLEEMKQFDLFMGGVRTAQKRFADMLQTQMGKHKAAAASSAVDDDTADDIATTDPMKTPMKSTMDTQNMPWTEIVELKQQHADLWAQQELEQQNLDNNNHITATAAAATATPPAPYKPPKPVTPVLTSPCPLEGNLSAVAAPPTAAGSDVSAAATPSAFTPLLEALQLSQRVWESKFSINTQQMSSIRLTEWREKVQLQVDQLQRLQDEVYPMLLQKQDRVQWAWDAYCTAVQTVIHHKRKRSNTGLRGMMTFSRAKSSANDDDADMEKELSKLPDVWWLERRYQLALQVWSDTWDMFFLGAMEMNEDLVDEYLAMVEAKKEREKRAANKDKETNVEEDSEPTDNDKETAEKDESNPQESSPNDNDEEAEAQNPKVEAIDGGEGVVITHEEKSEKNELSDNEEIDGDAKEETEKSPLEALRVLLEQMEATEAARRVDVAQKLKDWVKGQERLFVGAEGATKLAWLDWTTSGAVDKEEEGDKKETETSTDEKPSSKSGWLWSSGGPNDGDKDESGEEADKDEQEQTGNKSSWLAWNKTSSAEANQGSESDDEHETKSKASEELTTEAGKRDATEAGNEDGGADDGSSNDDAAAVETGSTNPGADTVSDTPIIPTLTAEEIHKRRQQVQGEVRRILTKKWGAARANDWLEASVASAETLYMMDDVFGLEALLDNPHVVSAAVGEWWQVPRPGGDEDIKSEVSSTDKKANNEETDRHLALVVVSSGPQMHLFNLPTNQVVLDLETPPHDALDELLAAAPLVGRRSGFPVPSLSLAMADAVVNLTEEVDTMEIIPSASTGSPCIRLLSPHLNNIY